MGGGITPGAFISPLVLCPEAALRKSGSQRKTREKQAEGVMVPCVASMPSGDWLGHLWPQRFIHPRSREAQCTKPW